MLRCLLNSQRPRISSSSSSDEFNIPVDLLIEILKRLPLKSLIRLTCVCKYWQSLLTSPTFVSAHVSYNLSISNNGNSPNLHLFKQALNVQSEDRRSKFFLCSTKILVRRRPIKCPVGRKHFIVSSCDGLLCFFDFYSQNPRTAPLILWNPSIQRKVIVPIPTDGAVDITPGGFPKLIFGVGLDSISNDYKVVRVAYFSGGSGGTRFRADVYVLGVGTWSSLDMTSVSHTFSTIRWRGVCLNGVIHWVCNVNASFDANDLVLRSLLTFQLGSEKFGEIKLPKELSNAKNQTVRVLTVPRSSKDVLGVIHKFDASLSLWVLEEYGAKESWAKLFCVNITGMLYRHDLNVGLVNEEAVIMQNAECDWISCDVRTDKTNRFRHMPERLDYVDTYVESLILLGQRNGMLPVKKPTRDSPKGKGVGTCRKGKAKAV